MSWTVVFFSKPYDRAEQFRKELRTVVDLISSVRLEQGELGELVKVHLMASVIEL